MGHAFLRFAEPQPNGRVLREIGASLMARYCQVTLSRSKWLKQRSAPVQWWIDQRDEQRRPYREHRQSKPISLLVLERALTHGTFDYEALGLFDPRCDWLDSRVDVLPKFHMSDPDGTALTWRAPTTLGDTFPLVPTLDREGAVFNSFQLNLQTRITSLRDTLVSTSADFEHEAWLQNLRSYASECVSLIDSTLHQLYFKAQYAPLPGWNFNAKALGERHGRRLTDKLKWVYQITGRPLNADEEVHTFNTIRALRNHLHHFDPPCLCYSIEYDAVAWLNAVPLVGRLAWKIRQAVGSPLSVPLIQMLLARPVVFVPERSDARRAPPAPHTGYASTSWPKSTDQS